jgi:uncharacterized protein YbaR (Trm112 family)
MDFMPVSSDLLKILACPRCKGEVKEKGMFILCEECGLAYPVLDGDVPDMLLDDAWSLEEAKKAKFKHRLQL